ncbi:hypothetical protein E0H80_16270 [Acinetobacter sp. ANC 4779]|uniref:hypothetical protein n=1 Tax=Acinetobacter sp. ANC 4779 TaxID=2529848 RepID=UPI00103A62FE|nr:hypothetical protein [Acinetobacter sp. ANC 4779]TCB47350.1 hypothetical protein E0H80_16270 [Acinetobacter sp. ANC 4779]
MTVENQFPYQSFTANGSQTNFALGFYVDDKTHFDVKKNDQAVSKTDYSYNSYSNSLVFNSTPKNGDVIEVTRTTAADRATTYATYNNSFRPEVLNKDIDRVWLKLQELGVSDWVTNNRVDTVKNYTDLKDAEVKQALLDDIYKQGLALHQLDAYYNHLLSRISTISTEKGWDASLIADGDKTQHQINEIQAKKNNETVSIKDFGAIGDGTLHTLQEWVTAGKYKDLAAIKSKFSFVTSLSQSIDWCATQYAVLNASSVFCPKRKICS